jgi:hypothetical protein
LTFDPLIPKSIGVICWSWPITIPSLKFLGLRVLYLLIGNHFHLQGQCDLDLWPLDPKINRVHLMVMTNHHTKFEVPRPKRSLVIDWKPFGLQTDGPTDRQVQSNIPSFLRSGGIIMKCHYVVYMHNVICFVFVSFFHLVMDKKQSIKTIYFNIQSKACRSIL